MDIALKILAETPPDVMNHNLETHPSLYRKARPGANYQHSLDLLKRYKEMMPHIPTKSGIMVGLGETDEDVREIMRDMRAHNIEMITIGQYLQPSDDTCLSCATLHPNNSKYLKKKHTNWALPMPPSARWYVQVTMPTNRRRKPYAKATAVAGIIKLGTPFPK